MSARTSPSATTQRGYWLLLARVLWVASAAVTLGAFAFSVPVRYSRLSHPSASVRAALEEMGLSPGGYALYNVALDAVFVAVCAVVAIVIKGRGLGHPDSARRPEAEEGFPDQVLLRHRSEEARVE